MSFKQQCSLSIVSLCMHCYIVHCASFTCIIVLCIFAFCVCALCIIALSTITLFFDNFYLLQCNIIFHCNKVQTLHICTKHIRDHRGWRNKVLKAWWLKEQVLKVWWLKTNGLYTRELNPYVVNTIWGLNIGLFLW